MPVLEGIHYRKKEVGIIFFNTGQDGSPECIHYRRKEVGTMLLLQLKELYPKANIGKVIVVVNAI